MTLMRFDPLRELDRLSERVLSSASSSRTVDIAGDGQQAQENPQHMADA